MKRTHFTVRKLKQDFIEKPYLTSAETVCMGQPNFFCYTEHVHVHEWNDSENPRVLILGLQIYLNR